MSSFEEESLIENIREHKSLYDIFSVDYKDNNIHEEAWEEIGANLQISDGESEYMDNSWHAYKSNYYFPNNTLYSKQYQILLGCFIGR
ncbi:uncharacterized protein LOC112688277 [Sipha flava]|uniref:Uncharacterized protein LOC112688277 n=1 Tax=Sipha flava TaxID=143950 RepID=A0A8B8G3D2_9HEMI|nr:uncharacterized protein LOC112688277 [Sipha flava]